MIKELIIDLAYDKITLTQALTRGKLIQAKLNSDTLKRWISNELNGYPDDVEIPEYRVLNIEFIGDFISNRGQMKNCPLMLQNLSSDVKVNFYEYKETGSIKSIEDSVSQSKPSSFLLLPLDQDLIYRLGELYRKENPYYHLISASRKVYPGQYKIILDQTKQKLLDILLELEREFPDLTNDYMINEEKRKIVKNIITNNIYGGNNPMNIAVGDTVSQSGNNFNISFEDETELASLGVDKKQIEDLKVIIKETVGDNEEMKSKIFKWLGSVTASVGARGLYDKIPRIIDFVQNLI